MGNIKNDRAVACETQQSIGYEDTVVGLRASAQPTNSLSNVETIKTGSRAATVGLAGIYQTRST